MEGPSATAEFWPNLRTAAKELAKQEHVWVFVRTLDGGRVELAAEHPGSYATIDIYNVTGNGEPTLARSYALPHPGTRKLVLRLHGLLWVFAAMGFTFYEVVRAGEPWWTAFLWVVAGFVGFVLGQHVVTRIGLLAHFRSRDGWSLIGRPPFEMNDG